MVRAAEPRVQDPFDVKSYALRHRYARASLVAWAAAEYVGAVEAQGSDRRQLDIKDKGDGLLP